MELPPASFQRDTIQLEVIASDLAEDWGYFQGLDN